MAKPPWDHPIIRLTGISKEDLFWGASVRQTIQKKKGSAAMWNLKLQGFHLEILIRKQLAPLEISQISTFCWFVYPKISRKIYITTPFSCVHFVSEIETFQQKQVSLVSHQWRPHVCLYLYIYLEPKCPLFCLEKTLTFFWRQNDGQMGSRYIDTYHAPCLKGLNKKSR